MKIKSKTDTASDTRANNSNKEHLSSGHKAKLSDLAKSQQQISSSYGNPEPSCVFLFAFCVLLFVVELNCLFNVTINDISVIYVTAHRCAGGFCSL